MINFKEELKKYSELMELEDIEEELNSTDIDDMMSILRHLEKNLTEEPKG